MSNFLKNNLVYFLAFATIVFAVVAILIGFKAPPKNGPVEPIKYFEASQKPVPGTPEITIVSTNIKGQLFQVIDPLVINFSQPINIDSLKVEVKPQKAIKKNQLTLTSIALEPDEVWDFDTIYDLTLEFSGNSYKFSFQTEQHKGI